MDHRPALVTPRVIASLVLALGMVLGGVRPAAAQSTNRSTTLTASGILATSLGHSQRRSVSYSIWSLNGNRVTLRYMLPISEAQRFTGTDSDVLARDRFGAYLLNHTAVQAAGHACPIIDQGYNLGRVDPLAVGAGFDGFEIFFQCSHPSGVVVQDRALFDLRPNHIDFARVQINNGRFSEQLFTRGHEQLHVPGAGRVPPAGIGRYTMLGIRHILGSADRLCFLLSALLLLRRPRQVAILIGGLAAGYALAVPAALYGGVVPRIEVVDAFVGFLIALAGAQLLTRRLVRLTPAVWSAAAALLGMAAIALLAHAFVSMLLLAGAALVAAGTLAAQRQLEQRSVDILVIAAAFGLLDGFILPAMILPMQLPAAVRFPMMIGYDFGAVGVEAAVLGALLLAGTVWVMMGQSLQARTQRLLIDLTTAGLSGLGVFWMISRLRV